MAFEPAATRTLPFASKVAEGISRPVPSEPVWLQPGCWALTSMELAVNRRIVRMILFAFMTRLRSFLSEVSGETCKPLSYLLRRALLGQCVERRCQLLVYGRLSRAVYNPVAARAVAIRAATQNAAVGPLDCLHEFATGLVHVTGSQRGKRLR